MEKHFHLLKSNICREHLNLLGNIMGTGRCSHPLEGHGVEGKTGKQTSNKCSKSVYNTIKPQRRNIYYHLRGQWKSLKWWGEISQAR